MAVTNAEDLAKLLSTAADSAASAANDAAEAERAVGALKQLQKRAVTAALLKETDAGKRVNKLSKHALPAISAAAAAVVQAWKECVKQEQGARGSGGGVGGGNGGDGVRSAGGGGASSSGSGMARTGSVASASDAPATAAGRATTTSSGGGAEPAAAPARAPAKATGASAVPPKSGNPKRDKARAMVFDGLSLSLSEGAVPAAPLGPLAAEVEDALWAANCEGCREPTPAYLAKVCPCLFVCRMCACVFVCVLPRACGKCSRALCASAVRARCVYACIYGCVRACVCARTCPCVRVYARVRAVRMDVCVLCTCACACRACAGVFVDSRRRPGSVYAHMCGSCVHPPAPVTPHHATGKRLPWRRRCRACSSPPAPLPTTANPRCARWCST